MEYTQDRIVRPPGTVTGTLSPPTAKDYECLLVEGTIQLAGYDADLNIVFPGGQKAVLQWRVDGPTLDLCFGEPVDVFNDGPDMEPAPVGPRMANQHINVVQLVIPLRPEYGENKTNEEAKPEGNLPYRNCPLSIDALEHYRPDGSCKCDDADERAMLIREFGQDYKPSDFKGPTREEARS